ncbi:hypothetical protein HN51_049684 [Arachis hypogaea]|uniref:uncharacterized protein LOC107609180 n=1 Tax=Arachis ipaensis TaxID=130454 RepID=UPI0007AF4BED|nr:uncharacterized protein LOC107609180 [Arachis ipaensis]XP_025666766.1 uncharacterized protein LOC112765116 [Arachis hypogaea]
MYTKIQPIVDRIYEDFEPYYEWDKDEGCFTFMLPGFRRDHLKVQVTSKPALKLKGERQISPNRWRRFDLEFRIPSDYDLEKVSAKFEFEGSKLQVKFAKLDNKPKETTTNPAEEAVPSRPKEEATEKVHQQNAAQEEVAPKAKEDKAQVRNDSEASDQKIPHKEEKEPSDEKVKNKTEASFKKVAQEKGKANNGITETKNAKPITRFKTKVLDFSQSLGPSNWVYNKEDKDTGINKQKRLVNCSLLTLLVVGIGLCAKTAFSSSRGGSKFQEK